MFCSLREKPEKSKFRIRLEKWEQNIILFQQEDVYKVSIKNQSGEANHLHNLSSDS